MPRQFPKPRPDLSRRLPPSFQSGEELGLAALAAVDGEAAGLLVRLVWWLIKVAVADIIAYEVATA